MLDLRLLEEQREGRASASGAFLVNRLTPRIAAFVILVLAAAVAAAAIVNTTRRRNP